MPAFYGKLVTGFNYQAEPLEFGIHWKITHKNLVLTEHIHMPWKWKVNTLERNKSMFSDKHPEHKNTLCEKNTEILILK